MFTVGTLNGYIDDISVDILVDTYVGRQSF